MKKLIVILILPLILMLVVHFTARAQQLYLGEPAQFSSFACDTIEQITGVLDAHKEHGQGAAQRLAQTYMLTPNENGEAACMTGTLMVTIIRIVKTYTGIIDREIIVIEVMNPQGFIFYTLSTIPVVKRDLSKKA